jgi:hypothetical protein
LLGAEGWELICTVNEMCELVELGFKYSQNYIFKRPLKEKEENKEWY